MKLLRQTGIITLLLIAAFLFACDGGGGSSDGGTGTLSLSLTDSSCGSYAAIYVTIDEVQANKSDTNGNSGWVTIGEPMKTYNLLELVNGVTEVLGTDELSAGFYKQIRLIIGKNAESENNINGEDHPFANYVVFKEDGTYQELKIPSGFNTGIKLVHNFEVIKDEIVELLLDFEACRSVVETGNGKYMLKPTIKIIKTLDKYSVFGNVTDASTTPPEPLTQAMVSAQITDGRSASVVRSTLTSSDSGFEGEYSILLSPGQTYNVVAFSDKKVGGPESLMMYAPACKETTIPDDSNIEKKFELEQTEYHTISGEVYVDGEIDSGNPPVVYVSFYSFVNCEPLQLEEYVEVTSESKSPDETTHKFSYSVDLPKGTYDVVASSEGRIPDTVQDVKITDGDAVVDLLEL